MRRPVLIPLAALVVAACGGGAPDVPPTVVLEPNIVADSAEGRARDLCRNAAQADGFSVLAVSNITANGAGFEMLLDLRDREERSSQRCIVSGNTVVLGAV